MRGCARLRGARALIAATLTTLLLPSLPARAADEGGEESEGPVVGVLEIQGEKAGLEVGQLEAITDWVREAARQAMPTARVITREQVTSLLRDNEKKREKCREAGNCELKLGRVLGADYVVTGSVTEFGGTIVLTLKMHDTAEAGAFVKGAKAKASKLGDLPGRVKVATKRLFAPLKTDEQGRVSFDPDSKKLEWKGPRGPAPTVPEQAGKLTIEASGDEDPVALLLEEGRSAYEAGDLDKAWKLLTRARKLREHPYIGYYLARTLVEQGDLSRACGMWRDMDPSKIPARRGEIRLERTLCDLPDVVAEPGRRLGALLRGGDFEESTSRRIWTVLAGLTKQRWAEVEPEIEAVRQKHEGELAAAAGALLEELRAHLYGFDPEAGATKRAAAIYVRRAVAACRAEQPREAKKQLASMRKLGLRPGPGFREECPNLDERARAAASSGSEANGEDGAGDGESPARTAERVSSELSQSHEVGASRPSPWGWATLTVGLAGAGAGTALILVAENDRSSVGSGGGRADQSLQSAQSTYDDANTKALGGVVGVAAGGALVATGVVTLLATSGEDDESGASGTEGMAFGVSPAPGGGTFAVGGRF